MSRFTKIACLLSAWIVLVCAGCDSGSSVTSSGVVEGKDFLVQAKESIAAHGGEELKHEYKDKSAGFSLRYPAGWGYQTMPGLGDIFLGPRINEDDPPAMMVLIAPVTDELTKCDYDAALKSLEERNKEVSHLEHIWGTFDNKKSFFQHTSTINPRDRKIEGWAYMIEHGGQCIVVAMSNSPRNFPETEKTFRSIVASFEFFEPVTFESVNLKHEEEMEKQREERRRRMEQMTAASRDDSPPRKSRPRVRTAPAWEIEEEEIDEPEHEPEEELPPLAERALKVRLGELLDDETLPFAIRYPSDWKTERMPGCHAAVMGPEVNGFPPGVTLVVEPPPKDLFALDERQSLKNVQKGNKSAVIRKFEKGSFAGKKAIRQHVVVTRTDGRTVEAWMYLIDTERECLILTFGDLRDNFAKSQPVFEAILATTRLGEQMDTVKDAEDFVGQFASNPQITEPEDVVLLTGPAGADGHKPTLRLTCFHDSLVLGDTPSGRATKTNIHPGDIRKKPSTSFHIDGKIATFDNYIDVTDEAKHLESLETVRRINSKPVRIRFTDTPAGLRHSLPVFVAVLQSFQERKK